MQFIFLNIQKKAGGEKKKKKFIVYIFSLGTGNECCRYYPLFVCSCQPVPGNGGIRVGLPSASSSLRSKQWEQS